MASSFGRQFAVSTAAVLATSLVSPALVPSAAAEESQAPPVAAQPTVSDAETAVSIEVRRTGRGVEVESRETEMTRVIANPFDSRTADVHSQHLGESQDEARKQAHGDRWSFWWD